MKTKKVIFIAFISFFSLTLFLKGQNTRIIEPQDFPDPFSPNNDLIKDECKITFVSSRNYSKWIVSIKEYGISD